MTDPAITHIAKMEGEWVVERLEREIERLRTEVEEWKRLHLNRCYEAERLTEALKGLVDASGYDDKGSWWFEALDIARRALEGK